MPEIGSPVLAAYGKLAVLKATGDPPVSHLSAVVLRSQMYPTAHCFMWVHGELDSGPHMGMTRTLLSTPPPGLVYTFNIYTIGVPVYNKLCVSRGWVLCPQGAGAGLICTGGSQCP